MELDYIIVGQGLAGSVLSLVFAEKGKRIKVINQTDTNSSSMVAAGLFNPITGKKMRKTWNADKLFPTLDSFYSRAERLLEKKFYHKTPIYRPFLSVMEQNEWMAHSAENNHREYIKALHGHSQYANFVHDPYGGIELGQSGYLDIPEFLSACKAYLHRNGCYLEDVFEESALKVSPNKIEYKGLVAKKLIYCNGFAASDSKYFSWLPFRPVKGELLLVQFEKPFKIIFNRGVFILPLPGKWSKVGATYNWQNLDTLPTEQAKKELIDKLNKLTKMSFEIKGQLAGIRPATKDRRPFIGLHPSLEPLGIFNGLGTKGVSLAPYFAERFNALLEGREELDPEVSINRYF